MDKDQKTIATVRKAFATGVAKELRLATGTTLAEAVAGIHVTAMAWSSWERGAVPSPSYALAVAPVLERLLPKVRKRQVTERRDLDRVDELLAAAGGATPEAVRAAEELRRLLPLLDPERLQSVAEALLQPLPSDEG